MNYDADRDEYVLSTGRRFYAHSGILGLGPEPDSLVTHGYDGDVSDDPDYYEDDETKAFTRAERQEIAAAMTLRWQAWADRR